MPRRTALLASLLVLTCACAGARQATSETRADTLIFGFDTAEQVRVGLYLAKDESGLVCRLYRDGRLDVVVPEDGVPSFAPFSRSGYFRGGGANNAGLDLTYCHFTHRGVTYKLYDEYSAEDDATSVGLVIGDTDLRGLSETRQGGLARLRDLEGVRDDAPGW